MKIIITFLLVFFHINFFAQCEICDSLDEALKDPKKVKVLTLNNNFYKEYPKQIKKFINLNKLQLSNYIDITQLNEESKNIINIIPSEISELKMLKVLEINDIELELLHENLGLLKNLEILNLSDNKNLTEIPSAVGELSNLRELHLGNIGLDSIPKWIGKLENLEKLYLWGNNISYLPDFLVKLKKLQVLDLSNNNLGEKLTLPEFDIGHWVDDSISGAYGEIVDVKENSLIVRQLDDMGEYEDVLCDKESTTFATYEKPCPIEIDVLNKMDCFQIEKIDLQLNNFRINDCLTKINELNQYKCNTEILYFTSKKFKD